MILKHVKTLETATGRWDGYAIDCLSNYSCFKENDKMIAISVVKQHAWDADPRAIQQINFLANLDSTENTTMFFIIEEAKRKRLFTKNCKGIVNVP